MKKSTLFLVLMANLASAADKTVLITNPVHPDANLPFRRAWEFSHPTNSETGICRALGYYEAAKFSSRTANEIVETAMVDFTGEVLAVFRDFPITQIVCIKSNFRSSL